MSIDSDRWTIAVRKYGQCAPWSFFATMEHADMDLTGLEGTLMCSMVGQNDHGAHIETLLEPTPTCFGRHSSRRKVFELKTCVSEKILSLSSKLMTRRKSLCQFSCVATDIVICYRLNVQRSLSTPERHESPKHTASSLHDNFRKELTANNLDT